MKLKNILLSGLSLVLVAALAIGGTVAYLQDEDSDVNVMTLGNVSIEQLEYERAKNEDGTWKTATVDDRTSYVLQPFTQAKPLLPSALNTTTWEGWGWDGTPVRNSQVGSYGGMSVFKDASNAQDKFVYVKNTGKTDAYVRTLVAVEVGNSSIDMMNFNVHLGAWTENEIGTITVDGNNYYLLEYVYTGAQLSDGSWRHANGVLPAGDMTYNSFGQVYIHSKATNEDMVAIDGNGNGTLDILVLSQAVQVAGFADAETALNAGFGDITTTNHPWAASATTVEVDSADELARALAAGNDVKLVADIAFDDTLMVVGTATLDLNGKTLTLNGEYREYAIKNYGELTVKGGTIVVAGTDGGSAIGNYGELTVEDATLDGAPFNGDSSKGWPSYVVNNYGEAIINNTTIVGDHGGVGCEAGSVTTLNNVNLTVGNSKITSNGVIAYEGSSVIINGGSYRLNADAHSSCNTVRVFKGATYETDGTATFSKPVWNQNN